MRAIRFHETGGPEVLEVEELDRPSPRDDEMLVDVKAIGVNPTEVYSREGYRVHELPRVPGADFAGFVESTGASVQGFEEGDRVFGTGLQNDRYGTYAEYTVAHEARVAKIPEGVNIEEAGAMGVVGTTAWLAFNGHATLTPASTCLVHGGSGGVGHVAIQLAKLCGATVITTAGSEGSREFVRSFGADTILDYTDPDLLGRVLNTVSGGIDVVLDHHFGQYLQFDLEVLGPDGTVVVIGGPQDEARIVDLWPALRSDATIQVFAMSNEPDLGGVLRKVARLMEEGRLDVHIAERYSLEQAGSAQRAVMEENVNGKLVLIP